MILESGFSALVPYPPCRWGSSLARNIGQQALAFRSGLRILDSGSGCEDTASGRYCGGVLVALLAFRAGGLDVDFDGASIALPRTFPHVVGGLLVVCGSAWRSSPGASRERISRLRGRCSRRPDVTVSLALLAGYIALLNCWGCRWPPSCTSPWPPVPEPVEVVDGLGESPDHGRPSYYVFIQLLGFRSRRFPAGVAGS